MERTNQPLTNEAARKLMALDVQDKEILTYEKLDEWYTAWGGRCYVSFSGGKDSTVLAYLAARYLSSFRTPPWELNLVFVNTGLEYPEIQKFVNEYADWLRREFSRVTVNLVRLRPKMNIRQVVTKYGYSIIGKDVAHRIETARRSPDSRSMKLLRGEVLRADGEKSMYNCEKWEYLLLAPFLISDKCCEIMKKSPSKSYEHRADVKPTTATMAEEGLLRMQKWRETGCNALRMAIRIIPPIWARAIRYSYLLAAEVHAKNLGEGGVSNMTLTEMFNICDSCVYAPCFCGNEPENCVAYLQRNNRIGKDAE